MEQCFATLQAENLDNYYETYIQKIINLLQDMLIRIRIFDYILQDI